MLIFEQPRSPRPQLPGLGARAPDSTFGEIYEAARDAMILADNAESRATARRLAFNSRINRIHQLTGIALSNPLVDGPDMVGDDGRIRTSPERVDLFGQRLQEIAQQFPQHERAILGDKSIEDEARDLARRSEEKFNEVAGRAPGALTRLSGSLIGGFSGALRDPLTVISMGAGGGPGTARTLMGRILAVAVKEAIINAGIETAAQPSIQKWRQQVGLPSGLLEGARNVGFAALFGATFGATARGAFEAGSFLFKGADVDQAGAAAAQSLPAGHPARRALEDDPAAVREVAEQIAPDLPAEARGALETIRAEQDLEGARPGDVAQIDHDDAILQAVRNAETPDIEPPARGPDQVPPQRTQTPSLADDAPIPGRTFQYLGRPARFTSFKAGRLETDAETFQYKGGSDGQGVTGRLAGVEQFDPVASAKVIVFERADKSRVIADGHQRLALANKLIREGRETDIDLDGYLFREADGWTPRDVRAIAAKKNIQEGSGDVIDTGRVLRERPDLLDQSVPLNSDHMRQARGLARLSDDAFGLVNNDVLRANFGALVGELIEDQSLHLGAAKILVELQPSNMAQARSVIADMLQAGSRLEVQETLFGTDAFHVPLVLERARILDATIKALKSDKRLFNMLTNEIDRIEAAGNVVDLEASSARVSSAEKAQFVLEKLANVEGPVSDALTRAAIALGEGGRLPAVARVFRADLAELLEHHSIEFLANAPSARPRGEGIDDPGIDDPTGPEAQAQIDRIDPDAAARSGSEPEDLLPGGVEIGEDGTPTARLLTEREILAAAERDEELAKIIDICKGG